MKKIYCGLLVSLLSCSAYAQRTSQVLTRDPASSAAPLDSLARYLDPTPISSGLLVDKALPTVRLDALTGTSAADDTVSADLFTRAYELLRDGALPGVPSALPPPTVRPICFYC